jgi:hypothetical protein
VKNEVFDKIAWMQQDIAIQNLLSKGGEMDTFRAYGVLAECERHESRLALERVSLLLVCNSILAVAFFTAVPTVYFSWLRVALPIIGIVVCIGFGITLWVGAKAAIGWLSALCKVEEEPEFAYMKERKIRPWTDIIGMMPQRKHIWKLGYRASPFFGLPIIALWTLCLVLA